MEYQVITTSRFKKSFEQFLKRIDIQDKKQFIIFQEIFDKDPFDTRLYTHSIFKDKSRNAVMYTSYITHKIRLIWILKGETIIVLHHVMTDHDYNKVKNYLPSAMKIIDMLKI